MNNPFDTSKQEALSKPLTYGVEAYISPEYIKAERDKLWRKVWLNAGRTSDIPDPGDFISYEILDDSVLLVRGRDGQIRAFHNVCAHRGRRLVDVPAGKRNAQGHVSQFICGYHGWRYDLEGKNRYILNELDWQGSLDEQCSSLTKVKVDTWGGWIWINLDPKGGPLRDFLEPAASLLDPFRIERQACKWRRWAVFDCNWKVAIEAFIETYHVPTTHPEFSKFGSYTGWGRLEGDHSVIGYDSKGEEKGRLRLGDSGDPRVTTAEMVDFTMRNVNSNFTQSLWDASRRLVDDLPEGTPATKVMQHWLKTARESDARRGVEWPVVDPDIVAQSGVSWNIFPNFRLGHAVNNALCYQARPHGFNPDKCIFEVSVFELYASGEEPKTEWIFTPIDDVAGWGSVLVQDFDNMAACQQGMKSVGFNGPRPNPKEERAVVALHEVLSRYMGTEPPRPVACVKDRRN